MIPWEQYDGSTPWENYLVYFTMVADLYCLPLHTRTAYVPASLRGAAQVVLSDLNVAGTRSYQELTAALEGRFSQQNQNELF